DLLVRRAEAEVALVAILEAQQLGAVLVPASRFLPQLGRLHRRHQHFLRAGAVHLFAHDRLDFAQRAQTERQPGVDAGGELADHARAQHQFVGDGLGVGGGFANGREQELGNAHESVKPGVEGPAEYNCWVRLVVPRWYQSGGMSIGWRRGSLSTRAIAPRISTPARNSCQPGCSPSIHMPPTTPMTGVMSEDSDDTATGTMSTRRFHAQ